MGLLYFLVGSENAPFRDWFQSSQSNIYLGAFVMMGGMFGMVYVINLYRKKMANKILDPVRIREGYSIKK